MAKCSSCGKPGAKSRAGRPALCDGCTEPGALELLLENPAVRQLADAATAAVTSTIDRGFQQVASRLDNYARAAFAAFQARQANAQRGAPAPTAPAVDARSVMGFGADEELTKDKVKKRYHELARVFHSDAGGHDSAMSRLNRAYEELEKQLEGT